MDITFVVLANSWKHGGRCVAGLKFEGTDGHWRIAQDKYKPIWIRPVTESEAGELPLHLVQSIKMLDVVQITDAIPCPRSFQSENHYFKDIKVISSYVASEQFFNNILDNAHHTIFNNRGKAVHPDHTQTIDYSLMFIKPNQFKSTESKNVHGNKQFRGTFDYNNVQYDLPITDPSFVLNSEENKVVYLTISLGVEFMGWHSKLIAGVFCI